MMAKCSSFPSASMTDALKPFQTISGIQQLAESRQFKVPHLGWNRIDCFILSFDYLSAQIVIVRYLMCWKMFDWISLISCNHILLDVHLFIIFCDL